MGLYDMNPLLFLPHIDADRLVLRMAAGNLNVVIAKVAVDYILTVDPVLAIRLAQIGKQQLLSRRQSCACRESHARTS